MIQIETKQHMHKVPEVSLIWSTGFSCSWVFFFFLILALLLEFPEQGIQPIVYSFFILSLSLSNKSEK